MASTKTAIINYFKDLVNLRDHIDTQAAAENIKKNVHFRGPNVYILAFAIIIASVGLNVNSIPVIIGAMLISPLMGPIMGFGLGVGINDTDLIRSALRNLAVMAGISIVASTLYFLITPLDLSDPSELMARTKPSIYDVLIALFGGFAGILETSRKEKGTVLSGVAIATALMPPLCTVGYGIGTGQWLYAIGALYLFLLNGVLIALATYLTVKFLHYKKVENHVHRTRRQIWSIGFAFFFLLVPSIYSAVLMVMQNNFEKKVNAFAHNYRGELYFNGHETKYTDWTWHYSVEFKLLGEKPEPDQLEAFYAAAEEAGIKRNQISINDKGTSNISSIINDEKKRQEMFFKMQQDIEDYRLENKALMRKIDSLQSELDSANFKLKELSSVEVISPSKKK